MELTYRQKQQLLTSYRNDGYELQVRLNAKGTVLDAEIVRIELLMDESSIVEVIAPSFFTQSEPFTCAYPTQQVSDFIDLANYADSPTQTPGLQPVAGEVP